MRGEFVSTEVETAHQLQPALTRSILGVYALSLLCTRGEFSQSVSVPARILSATAEEMFPVKLCPVGSSFSIAWQSLTTSPSKPHRSRSRSVRNSEFAQLGTPFTESTRETVDVVSIGFVEQASRQASADRQPSLTVAAHHTGSVRLIQTFRHQKSLNATSVLNVSVGAKVVVPSRPPPRQGDRTPSSLALKYSRHRSQHLAAFARAGTARHRRQTRASAQRLTPAARSVTQSQSKQPGCNGMRRGFRDAPARRNSSSPCMPEIKLDAYWPVRNGSSPGTSCARPLVLQ